MDVEDADSRLDLARPTLVLGSAASRYFRGGWRRFVLSPEASDVAWPVGCSPFLTALGE